MKTRRLFSARKFVYASIVVMAGLLGAALQAAPTYCIVMDSGTAALANASRAATDGVTATITGTVTANGTWSRSSTNTTHYNTYTLYDNDAVDATKWISFSPTLPEAGKYVVQIWWPNSGAAAAANIPVEISHAGGTSTTHFDQSVQGTRWATIGIYEFTAANDGTEFVKIRNNGGPDGTTEGKYIRADAIRFLSFEALTELDNVAELKTTPETAPGNYTGVYMIGSWSTSTSTGGYYGTNYWNDGSKLVTKAVLYTPVLSEAGTYEVQIWHPASSGFCTTVPVDICHAGITETVTVDQTANGGQWKTIGTYVFDASGTEYLKIRTDDGAGGTLTGAVIADAVRFVKQAAPPNTAPTITAIAGQTISMNTATGALDFTVGDGQTLPSALNVSATSSDQTLLPDANIVLAGSGAARTVTLTPATGQTGSATVTLTVSDGELTAQTTFTLTVLSEPPPNTAPTITAIANQTISMNTATGALNFTIGDAETSPSALNISATSSDQALLPDANIVLGGSGATRTVTLTPATGQIGSATVTLTVSDGELTAQTTFTLTVQTLVPLTMLDNTAPDDTDTASKVPGPGVTVQGNWTGSVSRTGHKGANYWQDGNTGGSGTSTVSKSVTYTPVLPGPGRYMVQMWWPRYATNFATNTPVDVKHNGVTETFSVNQRTGGEMWYSLGIFEFAGTGDEYLKIRNEGADFYVIADAVRFVSVDEQEPFVMSFEKVATNQSSSCRRPFGAGLYDEVSNKTYICWNGPQMDVYVRAYDHATEAWGEPTLVCDLDYTAQSVYHNYPVLTLAPDGKLVVYFCQHGGKLFQIKAPDAHSIDGTWTKTEVGSDYNTYPMPVIAGNDIYVFYSKNNDSSWPYRQYRFIKSSDSGDTWSAATTIIDTDKADPQKFDEVYGWGFEYNAETKRIGFAWTMAGGAAHNAAHKGLYFAWFDTTNNNLSTVAGTSLGAAITHSELLSCLVNGAVGDATDPVYGHRYPFTRPTPSFDYISGQPVIAYGFYDPNTGLQSIRCTRWSGAAWVDSVIQQNVKSFSDIRKNGIGELIALYHYSGNILMKSSQDGGATWEQVSAGPVPFSDGCDKVAELVFLDNIKAPLTAFLGLSFEDTTKPGGYNYDGIFPVYIVKEDIADSPAVFLVHPDAGDSVIGGSQLILGVAASGKPAPAYQWQVKEGVSANWRNLTAVDTNYTGIATDSLTILSVGIDMNGWEFRAMAENGGAPAYSNATTIVISLLPAFGVTPVSEQAAVAGRTVDLVASVSSSTAATLQWQVNDGTGWRNLTAADANFADINTNALSILSVTAAMNNWQLRLVASNEHGDSHTNATTLKVMAADLNAPAALAFDAGGNIYVADAGNNRIYSIDSARKVNTLAGSATAGLVDDMGTSARFSAPRGVAIHPAEGTLLVADTANAALRSITATGTASTFLGSVAGMAAPVGIAFDTAGDMYISDAQKHVIHVLRSGTLSVYAGASGTADFVDDIATGAAARFNTPTGIAFGSDGNLYVADTGNDAVRVIMPIDTNSFAVTTLAGNAAGISAPRGLVVSGSGPDLRVYLVNTDANNICEINESGAVTILAGHETGVAGFKDGIGAEAWFDHPEGIAIGNDGNLYVADTGNAVIRKITFNPNDEAVVTTQLYSTGSSFAPPPPPPDPGRTYTDGRRDGGGTPTAWFYIVMGLLLACRYGRGLKKR